MFEAMNRAIEGWPQAVIDKVFPLPRPGTLIDT
jgi:hypothetical protein